MSKRTDNSYAKARRWRIPAIASALGGALILLAAWLSPGTPARAEGEPVIPPIRHVFIINLENISFRQSFDSAKSPYISTILRDQGVLIENYYGIGHQSLDNYIAEISGQAPNPETQEDCTTYSEFNSNPRLDGNGQVVGEGCVFPATATDTGSNLVRVENLADQLDAVHLNWKSYQEDMGDRPVRDGGYRCGHPQSGASDVTTNSGNDVDKYGTKHNPFMYFHSTIDDDGYCRTHVAPLTELSTDLQSVGSTPNLAFITPDNCNNGHDPNCVQGYAFDGSHVSDGVDTSLQLANRYMKWLVPQILSSPAFRQDGMLVVTFDEAQGLAGVSDMPQDDNAACCNEIPGPNGPAPGILGPGGGKVGAVIVSPYIDPGSVDSPTASPTRTGPGYYNHYSLLRSLEDVYGITSGGVDGRGHLGFAAAAGAYPGSGSFGNDVFNHVPGVGGVSGELVGPAPRDATPGDQSRGPRPAAAGVTWEAPLPQGNDLRAVDCQSAESCIAVGDAGSALVRQSGGWIPLHTGVSQNLFGVGCALAATCLIVGDHGLVLSSPDDGQTWTKREATSTAALRGVDCPSESVCYVVGDGGTIERSGDGGVTWRDESPLGVTDSVARIECPTVDVCMATGGEKAVVNLLTTDGGKKWTSTNPAAIDNGTDVACRSTTLCATSTPNDTVTWTTDGGANWSSADWAAPAPEGRNRFLGIDCPADDTCYVAASRGAIFQADLTTGKMTPLTPTSVGDDMRDIDCPEATRCYAVGDEGQILATTDGSTWTSERQGLTPSKPGDNSDSAVSTLRAATCSDSGACIAVGDQGSVAVKTGPLAPWLSKSAALPDHELAQGLTVSSSMVNLFGVSCTALATCVAVGSYDSILRSPDGGLSWTLVPSPSSDPVFSELHAVSCPTQAICVAVGAYGRILRSTDAGSTWTEITPPTPYSLNGVSCSAGGACVAVGSMGVIYRSSDAGTTWAAAPSGTRGYLAAVSCPTDTQCVSVGQNGLALVSPDGGNHWAASASGVDDGLLAIDCPLVTDCTATGAQGTVVRTSDLGLTWTVAGTGTPRGLNGSACASTVVCYAVGDNATILALADQPVVSAPDVSIAGAAVNEGDSGLTYAPLAVTLDKPVPTGHEVDVSYAATPLTGDGAATPDLDYESVSGRLRFMPGESEKLVQVPIVGDTESEGDERLSVVLSDPDGAFVARGRAMVTILDDDPAPESADSGSRSNLPFGGDSSGSGLPGSGGVLGETKAAPCKVPRLLGRRLVSAVRLLARTDCAIGKVRERRARTRAGIVIGQSPRAGATQPGGGRVTLIVSRGRRARRR